jgi:hypothetical protein
MSPRRLALRLAACALAGAVMTVAMAWGCAAWSKPRGPNFLAGDDVRWVRSVPNDWIDPVGRYVERSFGGYHDVASGHGPEQYAQLRLIQVGVPFLSFELVHLVNARRGTPGWGPGHNGIPMPRSLRDRVWAGALPIAAIWPGFALDTAFYGTIVFLLWSAPGVIRRRARKRRGRCPACGYDLRGSAGSPCPECGA